MPPALADFSTVVLALTVLVAGVAGLARGFSGFGAALIFMPAASALVTPALAAPVLLLADGILSLGFLPRAWMKARRKDVGLMAMGAFIGVPLGTLVLNHADPLPLRWAIAALASSMLVLLACLCQAALAAESSSERHIATPGRCRVRASGRWSRRCGCDGDRGFRIGAAAGPIPGASGLRWLGSRWRGRLPSTRHRAERGC